MEKQERTYTVKGSERERNNKGKRRESWELSVSEDESLSSLSLPLLKSFKYSTSHF